jgi:hypothetical protein
MTPLLWVCALVYSLGVVLLVLRVQSNAARIARLESQQKYTLQLFEIEVLSRPVALDATRQGDVLNLLRILQKGSSRS